MRGLLGWALPGNMADIHQANSITLRKCCAGISCALNCTTKICENLFVESYQRAAAEDGVF